VCSSDLKHILVEKPFTYTTAEAEQLVEQTYEQVDEAIISIILANTRPN
jgi:hypothetical protein